MDEKKPTRYGLILAFAGLAAIAATFGLSLSGNSLASTAGHNLSYADICADPDKLGLPTNDDPLSDQISSAIEIAEGYYILQTVALHTQPSLPRNTIESIVSHHLTTLKLWLTVDRRKLTEFVANCSYFGRNAVGVSEAAQTFLDKPASKINLGEAAVLAGLLKGPAGYDPARHPDRARQRRDMILEKMLAAGKITAADMIGAKLEPVTPAKAGVQ